MNIDEARYKYTHDAEFRVIVDYMREMLMNLQYSAGDLREAATFAQLLIMENTMRPMLMDRRNVSMEDIGDLIDGR